MQVLVVPKGVDYVLFRLRWEEKEEEEVEKEVEKEE